MPVPTHFRFVIRGIFNGSPEEWSTSCHFTREVSAGSDANLGDITEADVTTAVTAYFGSNLFPANVYVSDFRFYQIGTDGKMEGNGPLLVDLTGAGINGAAGEWQMPAQIALCATLVADNRGPAKFGRMFLPSPNVSLDATGRVGDTQLQAQLDGLVAFLKAVSDTIDMPFATSSAVCNVSPGPAGSTTGTIQEVDHIEMGHVLDTIRNRRKSMLEERLIGGQIDW